MKTKATATATTATKAGSITTTSTNINTIYIYLSVYSSMAEAFPVFPCSSTPSQPTQFLAWHFSLANTHPLY